MQYQCSHCGMKLETVTAEPGSKEKCPGCGFVNIVAAEPVRAEAAPVAVAETVTLGYADVPRTEGIQYGGFWIRFVAYIVDSLILAVPGMFLGAVIGFSAATRSGGAGGWAAGGALVKSMSIVNVLMFVVAAIYFAAMHSSSWQATLGKRLCRLYVTTKDFKRISLWKGFLRYGAILLLSVPSWTFAFFVKAPATPSAGAAALIGGLLGLIPLIGYLMAAFHSKKKAFHDHLAGTVVLRGRPEELRDQLAFMELAKQGAEEFSPVSNG